MRLGPAEANIGAPTNPTEDSLDISEDQARIFALEVLLAGILATLSQTARGSLRAQMKDMAQQLGGTRGEAIMRLRTKIAR